MMKCDVCDTIIPAGASQCPNCGAKCKKEPKVTTPKEEKKVKPKPIKEKKPMDWGLFTKRFDIIAFVIGLIAFLSTCFDFSAPPPEVITYHAVHSFQTLQERYPESARQIDPYYFHAITFHDEFCNQKCKLAQLYMANDDGYSLAQLETTIYYEGIVFDYGLYSDENSKEWSEIINVSLPKEKSKRLDILQAIATLEEIEYDELYDFYKMYNEGGSSKNIGGIGVTLQLAPLKEKISLLKHINLTE